MLKNRHKASNHALSSYSDDPETNFGQFKISKVKLYTKANNCSGMVLSSIQQTQEFLLWMTDFFIYSDNFLPVHFFDTFSVQSN